MRSDYPKPSHTGKLRPNTCQAIFVYMALWHVEPIYKSPDSKGSNKIKTYREMNRQKHDYKVEHRCGLSLTVISPNEETNPLGNV